jgi:hypothetical protein
MSGYLDQLIKSLDPAGEREQGASLLCDGERCRTCEDCGTCRYFE